MTSLHRSRITAPFMLAAAAALSACGTQMVVPGAPAAGSPEPQLAWQANPRLPGVFNAPGAGNPAQPGLYAVFGRMDKGSRFPPHTHPDARLTTVMQGTMYLGTGAVFDEGQVKPYPAGSVVATPANTPHFMWAKDGVVVMQETGSGPTGMLFSP